MNFLGTLFTKCQKAKKFVRRQESCALSKTSHMLIRMNVILQVYIIWFTEWPLSSQFILSSNGKEMFLMLPLLDMIDGQNHGQLQSFALAQSFPAGISL